MKSDHPGSPRYDPLATDSVEARHYNEQPSKPDSTHSQISSVVIADRDTHGLEWADKYGVPARLVRWHDYPDRTAFTVAICDEIEAFRCEWVVLAGFMRIPVQVAIERFPNRIINIHPSLLPAFRGAHAVEDALEARLYETGVTVHVVMEDVDAGAHAGSAIGLSSPRP